MRKIHTRLKRKLGISNRGPKITERKRPKTFKTEESAHKWADVHKLKKESYSLVKVKKGKKFQIKKISK